MQSSRIECILLCLWSTQNTRCNTLSARFDPQPHSLSYKKCTILRQKVLLLLYQLNSTSTFFINDDRFLPRCCCSFFNFYVLLCCCALYISLLHIFHSVSASLSLSALKWFVCCCLVALCCCFRLYSFRNFVILCIFFFHGFETSFWCMLLLLFSFRLYAIYSQRGCICLCHAFNLYLRSLSMRCYAHLSLSRSCTLFLSLDFLCALLRLACIALPEHNNASQLTHHTHTKSFFFLIYKLWIMVFFLCVVI